MENKIDPKVQPLLDELAEGSYLVRQKQIAKLLEPYYDTAIPILLENLKYHGDNYNIRYNAVEILPLTADHRAILPLLRHIETETGWVKTVFERLRQTLKERDDVTCWRVNDQLIKYLEEGPNIPTPEAFDPVASENEFNDFLSALMKMTGVTELNNKTQKLAEEVKEKWVQPHDVSELKQDEIPEHQNILVEVIDTLSEFGGLHHPGLEVLTLKYIREYGFDSIAAQHALTALSKINPSLAITQLDEINSSSSPQRDTTIKRVVIHKTDGEPEVNDFTILAQEPRDPKWKERPYFFRYEKGLIFFLARGEEAYQWFVGQARTICEAIEAATQYLEHWIRNIDSLDIKRTIANGKYSRIHVADRYSDCVSLIHQHLDLEKWGFHQTHVSQRYEYPHERPQIIYDSERCRVKFSFRSYGEMHDQSDVLSIEYGRLHAADKKDTIFWNGESHHCWHQIGMALCFLDGLSTKDTAEAWWNPPIIVDYTKSKDSENISQPVKQVEMHAKIWEHYGQRLFELFDLRHPDVWEKFSIFVKQVYEIRDFTKYGRDKVC